MFAHLKQRIVTYRPWAPRPSLYTGLNWGLRCIALVAVLCTAWFAVWLWAWLNRPAPEATPMVTEPTEIIQPDFAAAARLLGAHSGGASTPPTLALTGVMAPMQGTAASTGAAVLSVEGQAPKAFKLGDPITQGWVLAELGPTYVIMTNQGLSHRIDLPKPTPLEGLQAVAKPVQ